MKNYNLEKIIEENLYELFAKNFNNARDIEIFTALANSLRQIIGKKWFHSLYDDLSSKRLYILSFEYSFGENLYQYLVKLNLLDEVIAILNKYNIDYKKINDEDLEFSLGFGDIGEISSYLLSVLTDYHKNVYAYGLRYRKGMLKQEIVDGKQIEKPDEWKVNKNPWEHEKGFSHIINFADYGVKAIPYDIPILSSDTSRVNTLRLWKSYSLEDIDFNKFSNGEYIESYRNINRANSIVEFLYPNEGNFEGKKLRLTQEYFFASACIQDILKKYKKYIGDDIRNIYNYIKIQINDIHPSMAILVFIEKLVNKYNLSIRESIEISKKIFVYMQLSLLPENFEKWSLSLVEQVCPNLLNIIFELDNIMRNDFQNSNLLDINHLLLVHDGLLDMLNLAYYMSKNIITLVEDYIFLIKTNYINHQYSFYKEKIEFIDISYNSKQYIKERRLKKICNNNFPKDIDQNNIHEIKLHNKKVLIDRLKLDNKLVNLNSVFVMHLGIFHEKKRQILSALGIALMYYRLKKNSNWDIPERIYFFGGKSYPNYYIAKETISFINALAKLINNDLYIKDKIKIVFIENYNNTESNYAIPASDIYLKLELLNMQATNISTYKLILSGSNLITLNSSYINNELNKENILIDSFGDDRESFLRNNSYNMHEYIKNNQEFIDLFNFYRNLPKENFPFDIDIIYNSIYYFNDENYILKDLFSYVETLENNISIYRNKNKWYDRVINNRNKLILKDDKESIENFYKKLGEFNDI